jgi:hypothetical protein
VPSPFPGMDPYLEDPAYWSDFHGSFLLYLRDFINERFPDDYEARVHEKVNLSEATPDQVRLIEPDLVISKAPPSGPAVPTAAGGVATLEPVTIPHLLIEEETHERWIEILHRPERSLVAVVELLCPSNKEEPGLHRYRDKRFALLMQKVHLVEIDLLLTGRRLTLREPLPPGDYYALVSRGDRRPDCQVWAWTLRQPLPTVPLPLKPPDPDLPLDLAAVFTTTYDRGRYVRSLPYTAPPAVHLPPETSAWAFQQVHPRP